MNNKLQILFAFIKYLLFILLPLIFINVYYLYDTYSANKMNDFAYNNILIPTIIHAAIICVFTVLLLETGRRIQHIIICPIIIVMHLILYALFNIYPSYFMYTEVISSLILVAVLIPLDHIHKPKSNL